MLRLINFTQEYWLALSLLLLTTITLLSLWPVDQLPSVPGTDKTHHFIAYGALIFPAALSRPKHWLLIAVFFIAWSGALELIQPYVNRYGEWLDLLANAAGIVCGITAASILRFFTRS